MGRALRGQGTALGRCGRGVNEGLSRELLAVVRPAEGRFSLPSVVFLVVFSFCEGGTCLCCELCLLHFATGGRRRRSELRRDVFDGAASAIRRLVQPQQCGPRSIVQLLLGRLFSMPCPSPALAAYS